MTVNNIAVFCGSNFGSDPALREEILELGKTMVERKVNLVYGGGHRGLMGEISEFLRKNGSRTIGVSPQRFYKEGDEVYSDEFYLVETMHERKAMMYKKADAFIVFPGGIGTMDECCEISTWYQIGLSGKPVVIYDYQNFFEGFRIQLERMLKEGFIKQSFMDFMYFTDDLSTIFPYLDSFEYVKGKWEK